MTIVRRLAIRHRHLAMCLVFVALCMKLVMPAGFMPAVIDNAITVFVCSGTGPRAVTVELSGNAKHADRDDRTGHGKAQTTCAFSGLGLASLTPVDPAIVAIAIAFVMALGFVAARIVSSGPTAHVRPPLRGPPVAA